MTECSSTAVQTAWRTKFILFGLVACMPAILYAASGAAAANKPPFQLISTVSLPKSQSISAFDISTVDAQAGIYAFSDRTNVNVDVFELNDNAFINCKANKNYPNRITLAYQVPGFRGAFTITQSRDRMVLQSLTIVRSRPVTAIALSRLSMSRRIRSPTSSLRAGMPGLMKA